MIFLFIVMEKAINFYFSAYGAILLILVLYRLLAWIIVQCSKSDPPMSPRSSKAYGMIGFMLYFILLGYSVALAVIVFRKYRPEFENSK